MLCVDEKTGVQALDRTAPMLPLMPASAQRRTHDYRRCGTTNLYAALDAASGRVISTMSARHRSQEFAKFLNLIDREVPAHLAVHIVLDNSLHPQDPHHSTLADPPPRFTFHFTPTYSSWMNLVERWFAELTTKWLHRGAHTSVRDLQDSINVWIEGWNQNPNPSTWPQNRRRHPRCPRHIPSTHVTTQDARGLLSNSAADLQRHSRRRALPRA